MKRFRIVATAFDRTLDFFAFLAIIVMIFVTVSVLTEVVMRYFLDKPQAWVLQFSEYGLVVITFLATAWVLKRGRHVKMDILVNHLSPGMQVIFSIVTSIMGTIICGIIFVSSTLVTVDFFQRNVRDIVNIYFPFWPLYTIISLGMFLLTIQFIRTGYEYLAQWKSIRQEPGAYKEKDISEI